MKELLKRIASDTTGGLVEEDKPLMESGALYAMEAKLVVGICGVIPFMVPSSACYNIPRNPILLSRLPDTFGTRLPRTAHGVGVSRTKCGSNRPALVLAEAWIRSPQ